MIDIEDESTIVTDNCLQYIPHAKSREWFIMSIFGNNTAVLQPKLWRRMTDEAAIIYAYNYYLLPCLSTVEQTIDWFGGGCLVRLAWFILSRMIDDIHYTALSSTRTIIRKNTAVLHRQPKLCENVETATRRIGRSPSLVKLPLGLMYYKVMMIQQ